MGVSAQKQTGLRTRTAKEHAVNIDTLQGEHGALPALANGESSGYNII